MRPNFPNSNRRRFDAAILAVLVLAFFGPFLGRAYHIDDPLFVWAARHIASHPFDFYGFDVHWYDTWDAMWKVTQNPPLGCYYLALFGSIFGFSEPVLHAAMMLPAWAALLGVYHLAARFGIRPLPAALLTLATPAFLVCGVSVMCDVPLVALWVWTIIAWDIGLRERRPRMLILAGVLIAVTTVTKYFGICLLPLLTAYSLAVDKTGWRRWIWPLYIAVALLVGYQVLTTAMYGRGLLGGAMGYAASMGTPTVGSKFFRIFSSLAFLGGCVGGIAFAALFLVGRRGRGVLAVTAALTLAVALLLNSTTRLDDTDWTDSPFAIWGENVYCRANTGLVSQFVTWTVLGAGLLLLAWQDYRRDRDPVDLLLALWIAGTFVFAAFVNWTLNGRSILPLVPAVAIILVRRFDRLWPERWPLWLLPTILIPSSALAIAVAWADTTAANAQRLAAERIVPSLLGKRPLWISGHWGWQFYAMEFGGTPWDGRFDHGEPRDSIIIPENNCNLAPIRWKSDVETLYEEAPCAWLTTMHFSVAAGYYAEIWGPMPFAFGDVPPERFVVRRLAKVTR